MFLLPEIAILFKIIQIAIENEFYIFLKNRDF